MPWFVECHSNLRSVCCYKIKFSCSCHWTKYTVTDYGLIKDLLTLFPHREEEAIQLDGLNASQIKEIREKSEKFAFQAEVNRMMKLIINSLYKNKEVSSMFI